MSTAASLRRPRDYDWALSFSSLAGALVATWALVAGGGRSSPRAEAEIGKLDFAAAPIRRRPTGELGWEQLQGGEQVHDRDAVFVPPGGSATFLFHDGSRLDVEENSLVILERPSTEEARPVSVALMKGSVSGVTGTGSLRIKTEQGVTTLAQGSQARLDNLGKDGTRVNVYAGKVQVSGASGEAELGADQTAQLGAGPLERLAPPRVRLLAPASGAHFYFHGAPVPIPLQLSGEAGELQAARVEVARDRLFREVIAQGPANGLAFTASQPGAYWWRAADTGGRAVSEPRRFFVVEDPPPVVISPAQGQTLAFGPQLPVLFAWRPVPGVGRYRLEVASSPDFRAPALSEDLAATHLRVEPQLAEGTYYWRIRSIDADRGESPFSAPDSFRLVLKPLPQAPTLLEPELEVGPASGKR